MFARKKKGREKIRHSMDRKRIIPTYGVSRFRDIIPPVSPFTTVPFLFTFSSHTFPLEYPFNRIKFSEEDTRKSGGDLPSTLLDREITRGTSRDVPLRGWIFAFRECQGDYLLVWREQVSLKDRRGRPWTHLDPTKLERRKIINPVPQKWERIKDEAGGEGRVEEKRREKGEGEIEEISPDRRAGL